MDQDMKDKMRIKVKLVERGICQKCLTNPSTSRIQILAHEKSGQKLNHIASKAATLCDECCVEVFSSLVDTLNSSVRIG